MKFLLDSNDLWEHVQPPTTAEYAEIVADTSGASTSTLISDDARKKKKKAAYLIYQSCSPLPQSYITYERDPAKMWATLMNLYSRLE